MAKVMASAGGVGEVSSAHHVTRKSRMLPELLHSSIAGATSGAVSRLVTAPFDVAKIRFQLDHQATPRYNKSMWAAMRSIYSEEGLISLWRGNLPAMLLWASFAGVQFGTYEMLTLYNRIRRKRARVRFERKKGIRENDSLSGARGASVGGLNGEWKKTEGLRGYVCPDAVGHFVFGAVAGGAATVASYPFDITRTALAYQGVPKRYENVAAFVSHTLRESGTRGFFRGMSAALVMVAPQMGVGFAVYETVKKWNPATATADSPASAEYWGMTNSSHDSSGRSESETVGRIARNGDFNRRIGRAAEDGSELSFAPAERSRDGRNENLLGAGLEDKTERRPQRRKYSHLWVETAWPAVAGGAAGITSKLAVFPLDTVKKRVQTQVMLERDIAYGVLPKYSGPIHAVRTIIGQEGIQALFRGSVPAMWKAGVSTAMTFTVYEWVKKGMGVGDPA